jgi:MFS family permease
MVALSTLVLAGGALGGRSGMARMFGLAIARFVGSCVLCVVAPDATLLIAR